MPFDDEDPPFVEPDRELDALANAVIGVAIEVHKQLGAGLNESLYEAAMCVELGLLINFNTTLLKDGIKRVICSRR